VAQADFTLRPCGTIDNCFAQVVASYTSGCVRIVVGLLATSMSIALALTAGKKSPKKTAAPS
jgi:hypothetical protein